MITITPVSATEAINNLNRNTNHNAATCPECLWGKDAFYANERHTEDVNGGTIKYIPLGRNHAVIVWPKGWRKRNNPDELYPTFSIYKQERAAFEYLDHTALDEWPTTVTGKEFRTMMAGRK